MKKKSQLGLMLIIFSISVIAGIILFSTANVNINNNSAVGNEVELTEEAEIENINEQIGPIMIRSEGEVEVVFDLVVDVGCKIGLGNDKEKINPSEQWQYHLEFTGINGIYDTEAEEIKDLDIIIEELIEDWLENNVKNKGRKKKMLERYVIIDYAYEITDWPPVPQ